MGNIRRMLGCAKMEKRYLLYIGPQRALAEGCGRRGEVVVERWTVRVRCGGWVDGCSEGFVHLKFIIKAGFTVTYRNIIGFRCTREYLEACRRC